MPLGPSIYQLALQQSIQLEQARRAQAEQEAVRDEQRASREQELSLALQDRQREDEQRMFDRKLKVASAYGEIAGRLGAQGVAPSGMPAADEMSELAFLKAQLPDDEDPWQKLLAREKFEFDKDYKTKRLGQLGKPRALAPRDPLPRVRLMLDSIRDIANSAGRGKVASDFVAAIIGRGRIASAAQVEAVARQLHLKLSTLAASGVPPEQLASLLSPAGMQALAASVRAESGNDAGDIAEVLMTQFSGLAKEYGGETSDAAQAELQEVGRAVGSPQQMPQRGFGPLE